MVDEKNVVEEWRDIEGYPDYQVSNLGRIRTFKQWNNGKIMSPEINKHKERKKGYLRLGLVDSNGKRKFELVHRLVAMAFIPNPNNYPEINHIDNDSMNNVVSNLEWCNRSHNIKHMFTFYPEIQAGENHNCAKLTNKQALEIFNLVNEGKLTREEIAEMYNVSTSVVTSINTGSAWSCVTNKEYEYTHRDRLSESEILEIYRLAHEYRYTQTYIAKMYGITKGEVGNIKNGLAWSEITKHKHVPCTTSSHKLKADVLVKRLNNNTNDECENGENGEIWKNIDGYGGLYKVSNYGNIKSYKMNPIGKLMKFNGSNGTQKVTLYDLERKKNEDTVSRVVATAFIPNPKEYPFVFHLDGNFKNNRVDNLIWVDQKEIYDQLRNRKGLKSPPPSLSPKHRQLDYFLDQGSL